MLDNCQSIVCNVWLEKSCSGGLMQWFPNSCWGTTIPTCPGHHPCLLGKMGIVVQEHWKGPKLGTTALTYRTHCLVTYLGVKILQAQPLPTNGLTRTDYWQIALSSSSWPWWLHASVQGLHGSACYWGRISGDKLLPLKVLLAGFLRNLWMAATWYRMLDSSSQAHMVLNLFQPPLA